MNPTQKYATVTHPVMHCCSFFRRCNYV